MPVTESAAIEVGEPAKRLPHAHITFHLFASHTTRRSTHTAPARGLSRPKKFCQNPPIHPQAEGQGGQRRRSNRRKTSRPCTGKTAARKKRRAPSKSKAKTKTARKTNKKRGGFNWSLQHRS